MKSLKESIIGSNNVGIVSKVKDNLKTCDNVREFVQLWIALGLDLPLCRWDGPRLGGNYTNYDVDFHIIIVCQKNMIVIYNDFPGMWEDHKTFKEYSEKVAKTLKMNMKLNKLSYGEEYILTFK